MSDEGFDWNVDMEAALDLDFKGWQPQPGDKVMGVILNIADSEPGQWGSYPILSIATRDGGMSVHCFHTVLRKAISRAQPGDTIGIKFKGRVQGANNSYEDYNVILQAGNGATPLSGGRVSAALPAGDEEYGEEPAGWERDS